MNTKLAWLAGVFVCVLFFTVVGLVYFFPKIAAYKFLGGTMLAAGLLIVLPTLVGLLWHVRRRGLRVSEHSVHKTSSSE